jgi:hypothetical protein
MIKVLSIGNSFSEDAQRYLHGIARADGVDMKTVNLYIGGCSLEKHYRNMLSGNAVYDFQINGINYTGIKISIEDALLLDSWDYITVQQQSKQSCDAETFIPYIDELCEHIRTCCPKAKLLMMETWGYKEGSQMLTKAGYERHEEMLLDIRKAYKKISKRISADGIIYAGEAVLLANKSGYENIYRDEFHMSKGFGRYMIGLTVYGTVTNNPIENNTFRDFDEEISEEDISLAKKIAAEILSR